MTVDDFAICVNGIVRSSSHTAMHAANNKPLVVSNHSKRQFTKDETLLMNIHQQ